VLLLLQRALSGRAAPSPLMAHRVAREAEAELDDIWYYIAKESAGKAPAPPTPTHKKS